MPREGHDFYAWVEPTRTEISIHVPREGHDSIDKMRERKAPKFQSTCPARGTTLRRADALTLISISIHVPREGHDKILSMSAT